MQKILSFFATALLSCSAMADHHHEAEVAAASEAYNTAYENNDVDTYFDFYTEDAVVFFYGKRQSVAAYREEWTASIKAGASVELNKTSDLRVQMMPSGDVAVVSSFIDNRTRAVDGGLTTVKGYETEIWQKIAGKWRLVGLHYSEFVPAK
jgi:ketosteroid isomerase-like protein